MEAGWWKYRKDKDIVTYAKFKTCIKKSSVSSLLGERGRGIRFWNCVKKVRKNTCRENWNLTIRCDVDLGMGKWWKVFRRNRGNLIASSSCTGKLNASNDWRDFQKEVWQALQHSEYVHLFCFLLTMRPAKAISTVALGLAAVWAPSCWHSQNTVEDVWTLRCESLARVFGENM